MALFSALQFSNLQKNPKRLEKFVEKFNAKEDFTLVNGKKIKIKQIEINKVRYNNTNIKMWNKNIVG